MRHRKRTFKIGRTSSHRRCMIANMLKSLIQHGRMETTVVKAKELRRHAEKLITLAKKNTLDSQRKVIADLMINYNTLSSKESRLAKKGRKEEVYNVDRLIMGKLFGELSQRFLNREGGYTRILRLGERVGDNAPTCIIEFLP